MANGVIETNAKYISTLSMNGVAYTIKDAWARAEIAEIESAIAGGVHFRGISTTEITDGETVKDLTVGGETYTAASQVNGDIFIYNDGTRNLEFVVINGKYSEFGSTGTLGAFAYANSGAGSVEVPIASAITFNTFTPDVSKGTLAVTTTAGDGLTVTTTAAAASVTATAPTATASAPTVTVTVDAPTATVTVDAPTATVTVDAPTATVTVDAPTASVTVEAPTINVTNTAATFSALTFSTYDEPNATLTITTSESSSFWTGATITADAPTATVTVDAPTATVTVDAPTATVTVEAPTATVTVEAPTATVTATAPTITVDAPTVTVTYDKASGTSGTYLSAASLEGELTITGATPTATITNPTITVTVSPVEG